MKKLSLCLVHSAYVTVVLTSIWKVQTAVSASRSYHQPPTTYKHNERSIGDIDMQSKT